MSMSNAAKLLPQVQHNFDGDVKVLNATFDTRLAIRKGLTTLAQELQKIERQPMQIIGEIKIKIGGPEAKLNVYTVTVTDSAFDADEFARQVPLSEGKTSTATPSVSDQPSRTASVQENGQQGSSIRSPLRPEGHNRSDDDEVLEIRPFKRPRHDGHLSTPSVRQNKVSDIPLHETSTVAKDQSSGRGDQLFAFIKEWHSEWVRQGGWLFDNITKANNSPDSNKLELEKKLDAVQDVLGQSLNSASANIMSEIGNLSKLAP